MGGIDQNRKNQIQIYFKAFQVIKIKTYGHAVLVATIGVWTLMLFENLAGWFIGSLIIGFALRLARQSGFEDSEN